MAITLTCPRCMHKQQIDDDKAGKEVPCKICHHVIKPAGEKAKEKSKLTSAEKTTKTAEIQAGPPRVDGKQKDAKDKKSKTANPTSDSEGEDAETPQDRPPVRKPRGEKSSSTAMYALIGGGGIFVLVTFLCAGGGVGAYFLFRSAPPANDQVAQDAQKADEAKKGDPAPGPDPKPIPAPDPIPIQEPLDPNNPRHIDRVMDLLRAPPPNRDPAFSWLQAANPIHPRRNEVAKLLDGMVQEQRAQPFGGNAAFFAAYFRWATKDNTPTLIVLVESDNQRRHQAMLTLGKLKDARGADALARRLPDFGASRQQASDALRELGPVAQSAVLKVFNHPDPGARDAARRLIQGYNTPTEAIIDQCIADLDPAVLPNTRAALQWFGQTPALPQRRIEVSRALNKRIANDGNFTGGDLAKALENWGTAENVPNLIIVLEQSRFGRSDVIRILGQIRDPQSVPAIAKRFSNFSDRAEASRTLKAFGGSAEQGVIEVMTSTPDRNTRVECTRVLAEIGTRANSVPALQLLIVKYQPSVPERNFVREAQLAQMLIEKRGK